ncbi:MAG: ABC transporter ATP-binding protein [Actinobacteria bacterium]|nr:ABC transporter ATP-binding protein [Actinomycetota bacterium]
MLEVSNVDVYFGAIQVLKGVSFSVPDGEIVALIGSNGAGKSTTLLTISGVIRPARGNIALDAGEIGGSPPNRIVERGISHVPEGKAVFPTLTVKENLELGAYSRKTKTTDEDFERVYGLFPVLKERHRQLAGTLSGGEQKMLAIGRALMARPRLLLLDEPSLGLAPKFVELVFNVVKQINRTGTTILLVEQNAYMALEMAHRAHVMELGRVVMSGTGASLLQEDRIRKLYLGH